jgi:hypothetical protein
MGNRAAKRFVPIEETHAAFSRRDIDGAFALMSHGVVWANRSRNSARTES